VQFLVTTRTGPGDLGYNVVLENLQKVVRKRMEHLESFLIVKIPPFLLAVDSQFIVVYQWLQYW
jgi:hypothetical protein